MYCLPGRRRLCQGMRLELIHVMAYVWLDIFLALIFTGHHGESLGENDGSVRGYVQLAIVHFAVMESQLSCQKSMGTRSLCKCKEIKASPAKYLILGTRLELLKTSALPSSLVPDRKTHTASSARTHVENRAGTNAHIHAWTALCPSRLRSALG